MILTAKNGSKLKKISKNSIVAPTLKGVPPNIKESHYDIQYEVFIMKNKSLKCNPDSNLGI